MRNSEDILARYLGLNISLDGHVSLCCALFPLVLALEQREPVRGRSTRGRSQIMVCRRCGNPASSVQPHLARYPRHGRCAAVFIVRSHSSGRSASMTQHTQAWRLTPRIRILRRCCSMVLKNWRNAGRGNHISRGWHEPQSEREADLDTLRVQIRQLLLAPSLLLRYVAAPSSVTSSG